MVKQFAESIRERTVSTFQLQLIFIHLRESEKGNAFWEWGSSVAHAKRNQGWLWESAISIWATHLYYTHLDHEKITIDSLPADIFQTLRRHLEVTPETFLQEDFADLFPAGISRSELLHTLDHLYDSPRGKKGAPEGGAFYKLSTKRGIPEEDEELVRRVILSVEDSALSIPPARLSDIVDALETELLRQGEMENSFSDTDRQYLQLHCLVAFHDSLLEFRPNAIRGLSGIDPGDVQPMAYVSCMEDNITLDIGFFEIEEGFIEPASILSPTRNLTGGRLERFSYPFLSSDLLASEYVLESDENIRATLYNHPLRVTHWKGKHVIIAEERDRTRYQPTPHRDAFE